MRRVRIKKMELIKENQFKSNDNLSNSLNYQEEIKNQDGNKDDDQDTIANFDKVESGKIKIKD